MTDFFDDLEHELRRAHRRDTESHARSRVFDRRRLPGLPAAGVRTLVALAVVVALVAVVVTVGRESDVERPAAAPGEEVVATDVDAGVRFSLVGRVLTVQLLPPVRNQTVETVNGARISATCSANVADPRPETTLTRVWPAGQTSLSYHYPRDVSSWCRLNDQSGSLVASVNFPGAWGGERGPIAETANQWARQFAASPQTCTDYMTRTACEQVTCKRGRGVAHPGLQGGHAGVGRVLPRRDGPGNRHQRRPSGRHAHERRDRPAATYRDGRVADRQDGVRGCGFRAAVAREVTASTDEFSRRP